MIFDHVGYNVGDFARSKAFYLQALAPLGIGVAAEGDGWAMFGRPGKPQFWIGALGAAPTGIHVAFAAADRAQVRGFHAAALAAGGRDNGAPACGRTITPTTTAPSSSTPMATTSRRCAMHPSSRQ